MSLNTLVAVGALLAAIVIPLFVYRRQRSYKELTYETFPPVRLINVRTSIRERVEITVDGEQVEDVEGVAVEFRNTGTLAVGYPPENSASNLDTPVTLDFGEETRIIGDPEVKTEPDGLRVDMSRDPEHNNKIVLDRFLLNPGETLIVTTILTNLQESVRVSGHIKDHRIREHDRERSAVISTLSHFVGVMLVATLILLAMTAVIGLTQGRGPVQTLLLFGPYIGVAVLFLLLVGVLMLAIVFRSELFRRN